jgi:putative hydrolase of the HAD superfamily
MKHIKVVSFDMEGTLVTHKFSQLIWETDIPLLYSHQYNLELESARKFVLDHYDTIEVDEPEWYDTDYWLKRFGIKGDLRELLLSRRDDCETYPETKEVLEHLNKSYKIIISSNTIREFLNIQISKLPKVFNQVFSAPSDFGTVKNSEFFFKNVLNTINVKPDNMVHIGDSIRFDYEAARKNGISAYHLDRSGNTQGPNIINDLNELKSKLSR